MAERKKPQVPMLAVIAGGLVVGAVLFGAFRGMKAQPVASETTADPFGSVALPAIPPADPSPLPVPPIQPAGAVVPVMTTPLPLPSLPKADAKPEPPPLPVPVLPAAPGPTPLPPVLPDSLPKPVEALPAPKPVEALPAPKFDPAPVPLPAPKPVEALPAPKFDPAPVPLPAPSFTPEPLPASPALPPAKIDPIPDMKPVDLLPKPVDLLPKPVEIAPVLPKPVDVTPVLPKPTEVPPMLPKLEPVTPRPADTLPKPVEIPQPVPPVKPLVPTAPVPTVKPENGLRPEPSPLTVNPGPAPVGPETLPPPRKVGNETAPPPRPVVEESVTPMPKPDTVVPIAAPYTPGSTPMTFNRHTVLSAVMGAALAAAPAYADEPKPADAEAIKAIQKEIADLKADVKLLKEQRNELDKLLNGIPESQRKTPAEKGALVRMQEAEAAAEKMAKSIKELETQLAQKSVSEKVPVGGSGAGITPGRGLVKLVNEYNVKVSMVVNGTSYQLGVNEVKSIEVPEGKLKYELVEFPNASAKETTIKEGETVTLRIK